jgi:ATP phosphoribosyltransferase
MRGRKLRIAIPKGRLLRGTLERFEAAGAAVPTSEDLASRRLVFDRDGIEWILVKDGDVPVYVEHGAADAGVVGLDQVLEHGADVLRPVELGFGRCALMLIAAPGAPALGARPGAALATKYPNIARSFLERRSIHLEIVPLQGSVELASVLGLAPWIIDLVETGETIRVHGLQPLETIVEVSPQLIVNKSSWRMDRAGLRSLVDRVARAMTEVAV